MRSLAALAFAILLGGSGAVSADTQIARYPQPSRLFAVGDIHGDATALRRILFNLNLIDAYDNWTGGSAYLVFTGDILDRGAETRAAIDLIMKITAQAPRAKGRVITLLGNHELMVAIGDLRYFSKLDLPHYSDFMSSPEEGARDTILAAFGPQTKYGKWISSLPAMVIVGDTLFAHGGIEDWIQNFSIEDVNRTVHSWIMYYLGEGDRPAPATEWVIGDHGPMWTRLLATQRKKVSAVALRSWLQSWNVRQLVIGHTISRSLRPEVASFEYGSQLVMIDSAISSAIGGNLSAVEYKKAGWLEPEGFKPYVFERPYQAVPHFFIEEEGIDYVPKQNAPGGEELPLGGSQAA